MKRKFTRVAHFFFGFFHSLNHVPYPILYAYGFLKILLKLGKTKISTKIKEAKIMMRDSLKMLKSLQKLC